MTIDRTLYPHMSVYENMAFGLTPAKVDRAEIDRRVRGATETLSLRIPADQAHLFDADGEAFERL